MASVFLVCQDNVYRESLRTAFETRKAFDVCGDESDGSSAIKRMVKVKPNLIILEQAASLERELLLVDSIKRVLPGVPLFLVTGNSDSRSEKLAIAHGVDAVFEKETEHSSILLNAHSVVDLK